MPRRRSYEHSWNWDRRLDGERGSARREEVESDGPPPQYSGGETHAIYGGFDHPVYKVAERERCAIHGDILEEVASWSDEDDYEFSWLCPACDPDGVDAPHAAVRRSEDAATERRRESAEVEGEVRTAILRRNNLRQLPAE